MEQSIIERDIDFYTGEVERLRTELRRCFPEREPTVMRLIAAAETVRASLIAFNETMIAEREDFE